MQLMNRPTALAVFFFAIAANFSAASAPAYAAPPDGKALYAVKCAMCHGSTGTAAEMWAKKGAPNFNDAAWQKTRTDEALVKAVEDGNPAKMMPSYKDKMTADEIKAIVKYVRTLTPSK
jgi:mono/diheme cytochrome c family protein